jgi:hypothetical protein
LTARLLEVELIELFEEEIEIEAEAECVSAALGEAQAQGVAHRLSAQAQQHRRPESFLICMWVGAPGRFVYLHGTTAAALSRRRPRPAGDSGCRFYMCVACLALNLISGQALNSPFARKRSTELLLRYTGLRLWECSAAAHSAASAII